MKIKLIYPKWEKLRYMPVFHMPPHGAVCFAAEVKDYAQVSLCDENVEPLDLSDDADLIAISVTLSCQIKRGWEIADIYRAKGKRVIFGGIASMLHYEETKKHADSVFLGEVEGRFGTVINDLEQDGLRTLYDFSNKFPDIAKIGNAERDILNKNLYKSWGTQIFDLIHASRGCKFKCAPCSMPYISGAQFRPRPIQNVVDELKSIENKRVFFVDNSFAQDKDWEKQLFKAIAPLKKKWLSHPVDDDDDVLVLAVEAGCGNIYQSIVDTSASIRKRIKKYHSFGIGVHGGIMLGMDFHDKDYIKRLIEFVMDIELDFAEFTILTPFPKTAIRDQLEREGRILSDDWTQYTGMEVLFRPLNMSVDELQDMYDFAWNTFYRSEGRELKLAKLFRKVI